MRRMTSAGEPKKPSPQASSDKTWTPAGFEEKPLGWKDDLPSQTETPRPQNDSRGGQYTEAVTKDGCRYRRYF